MSQTRCRRAGQASLREAKTGFSALQVLTQENGRVSGSFLGSPIYWDLGSFKRPKFAPRFSPIVKSQFGVSGSPILRVFVRKGPGQAGPWYYIYKGYGEF